MEKYFGPYRISTNKRLLQVSVIHRYLSTDSYWAKGIPKERVRTAIKHSICFGIYHEGKQIGFCRVVSDCTRFAWLADVFILPEHRGQGLSKRLMGTVMEHPDLQRIQKWMLGTLDAHSLYEQYGFKPLARPERMMEIPFSGVW